MASAATDRVLDAAERAFLERGYAGARLRGIADALGIQPASLYHHAPGGKAELWRRVVDRAFERHHSGMRAALDCDALREGLLAAAAWLLSQPPIRVTALASEPSAPDGGAGAAGERAYAALMVPVADAVRAAQARGEVRDIAPDLFAGVFVASINGLGPAAEADSLPRPAGTLATEVVDLLLQGARAEPEQPTFC